MCNLPGLLSLSIIDEPEQLGPAPVAPEKSRLTPGRFALALAILVFACFWDVLLGFKSFIYRDFGLFGYPLAFYAKESFQAGELPFWNPLSNCGLPFLAQWNTLILYPGSLICLLLPLPWSANVFCLAHLFLAGVGMFRLAAHWGARQESAGVAGVAFAFGGLTLNCLMWPNNIAALAWMPWLMLTVDLALRHGGRRVVLAGLVGAAQMYSGAPEIILFSWGMAALNLAIQGGGWSAGIRSVGRFALVCLVALGLSAPQLLPFLQLLGLSQRDAGYASAAWAMSGWGWVNFLIPLFGTSPTPQGVSLQEAQVWTSSYYAGIGVLALALVAAACARTRRVWILAGCALLALLFSMGEATPVYRLVRAAVPQLGFLRYPIKAVVVPLFALPLLAALGLDTLMAMDASRVRKALALLGLAAMTAIAGVALVYRPLPWMANAVTRAALLAGILSALAIMRLGRGQQVRSAAWILASMLVFIDLVTHVPWQNPVADLGALRPDLADLGRKPRLGESRAMLTPEGYQALRSKILADPAADYLCRRQGAYGNCNLLDHLPKTDGFFSLYLRREFDLRMAFFNSGERNLPLLDFQGVAKISDPNSPLDWLDRPAAMPLLTAGQAPVFAEPEASLALLTRTDFDSKGTVLLPPAAKEELGKVRPGRVVFRSTQVRTHEIRARVDSGSESVLVVAQSYYPNWKAYVNGAPARLWPANHAFQAVKIPAGESEIRIVYEDRPFRLGCGLAALTALCGGAAILADRRRRQAGGAPNRVV